MARIRTIKPEFWTDSKTGTLSDRATKLFAGMLNFADDFGLLQHDVGALKAQIFPYLKEEVEDAVAAPLANELLEKGLVEEFGYSDPADTATPARQYLFIKNFGKHQKVDRPGRPLIPGWTKESTPSNFPGSTKYRRGLVEDSSKTRRMNPQDRKPPESKDSSSTRRGLATEGKGSGSGREVERKGSGSGMDTSNDTLAPSGLGPEEHRAPGEGVVDDPEVRAKTLQFIKEQGRKIGGVTSTKDRGNGSGKSVGKEDDPILNLSNILEPEKYKAMIHAYGMFTHVDPVKRWTKQEAEKDLGEKGFDDQDFMQIEFVFQEREQA